MVAGAYVHQRSHSFFLLSGFAALLEFSRLSASVVIYRMGQEDNVIFP